MERYITYCTPEQTKKALELGAPIIENRSESQTLPVCKVGLTYYIVPTVEQMIGWLEGKDEIKSIVINVTDEWEFEIWGSDGKIIWYKTGFDSRKESTIAAIDAALEYLKK